MVIWCALNVTIIWWRKFPASKKWCHVLHAVRKSKERHTLNYFSKRLHYHLQLNNCLSHTIKRNTNLKKCCLLALYIWYSHFWRKFISRRLLEFWVSSQSNATMGLRDKLEGYTRYHAIAFFTTFLTYGFFHASRKTLSNSKDSISIFWTSEIYNSTWPAP